MESEAILIAFLNAALRLPQESRIEDITILNPELNKEYKEDKKSILDVRVVTIEGMQINIEIELSKKAFQGFINVIQGLYLQDVGGILFAVKHTMNFHRVILHDQDVEH